MARHGSAAGYQGDKPDIGWWMERIHAGEKFRARYAYEAKWERWQRYYRNEFNDQILPKNLFFPMLRAIVPRVYFRNPRVSIRPKIPGFLNMAFAQILNRIVNRLIRESGIKAEMKDCVEDAWMSGVGTLKLGFGNLHGATSDDAYSAAPLGKGGERYEYDARVSPGMPWARRVAPGNIVWPDGTRRVKDARWVAEFIRRPIDDVKRDPRFKNTEGLNEVAASTPGDNKHSIAVEDSLGMVDLYEVRDFKYKRVMIIAPNAGHTKSSSHIGKTLLDIKDDRLQDRQLPYRILTFNPDSRVVWGVPFAQELERYQLEANEISTQAMKHRRASLVKLAYQSGMIDETELAKLFTEDAGVGIKVKGSPRNTLQTIQTGYVPQDLQIAEQQLASAVRETMGFSRNEMGEFQTRRGDTSAEEARNVHDAAEVRLNEMRDEAADMVVSTAEEWIEIIFDNWNEDIVIDVVGPGGVPIWVQMRPSELKYGRYVVEVDPESAAPVSRQVREQMALQRYEILSRNPTIDPMKLTKYLLTEMDGVEMDDLMRQMPAVPGTAGQTVGPTQLAGILEQGFRGGGGAGLSLLGSGV